MTNKHHEYEAGIYPWLCWSSMASTALSTELRRDWIWLADSFNKKRATNCWTLVPRSYTWGGGNECGVREGGKEKKTEQVRAVSALCYVHITFILNESRPVAFTPNQPHKNAPASSLFSRLSRSKRERRSPVVKWNGLHEVNSTGWCSLLSAAAGLEALNASAPYSYGRQSKVTASKRMKGKGESQKGHQTRLDKSEFSANWSSGIFYPVKMVAVKTQQCPLTGWRWNTGKKNHSSGSVFNR